MLRMMVQSARTAYAALRRFLGHLLFDRRIGVETASVVRLRDLGLEKDSRVDYEPSPLSALRRVLPRSEIGPEDVFLDFGCGKGRVVVQAATYPFKRVIGVELSTALCEIARQNIYRARARFVCRDVELVNQDALEYAMPDDVTVVYFYNPFEGAIFEAVVEKLVASLRRNPRVLRVVYMNPVEELVLLRAGAEKVRGSRGFRPTAKWARENSVRLYRLRPPKPVMADATGSCR